MMPGQQNEDVELKVSYMVKRSQGKSALGATNFKKRVFCLTLSRFSYYDGTVEVRFPRIYLSADPKYGYKMRVVYTVYYIIQLLACPSNNQFAVFFGANGGG